MQQTVTAYYILYMQGTVYPTAGQHQGIVTKDGTPINYWTYSGRIFINIVINELLQTLQKMMLQLTSYNKP